MGNRWFSIESTNDRPLGILKGKGSPYVWNTITAMWNTSLLGLVLLCCTGGEVFKCSLLVKYGKWELMRDKRLFHEFCRNWDTVYPSICMAVEKFHGMRTKGIKNLKWVNVGNGQCSHHCWMFSIVNIVKRMHEGGKTFKYVNEKFPEMKTHGWNPKGCDTSQGELMRMTNIHHIVMKLLKLGESE